ncbi:MAG TPA: sigma-70 family RNA polymerase sigma factor [Planctomycetota bacterium]|nr:sigma-70 family RNA polymerase sigma factor [Planctomycetota bacterium]
MNDRMALLDGLVRAHQARLRAYLFSRTGDIDAADDLAQEVFLVVFRLIDQYDAARPAWPWLMGIARNELREHWRGVARDKVTDAIEALAAEQMLARDETEKPSDRLPMDALATCLSKLPEHSRELVRMIYTERINCAEAAKRLQQKAGAVRVTIHRIRRALAACVQSRMAEKPA